MTNRNRAKLGVWALAVVLCAGCVQPPKNGTEEAKKAPAAPTALPAADPAPAPEVQPVAQVPQVAPVASQGTPAEAATPDPQKPTAQAPSAQVKPGLQAFVKNSKVKKKAVKEVNDSMKAFGATMKRNPQLNQILKARRDELAKSKSPDGKTPDSGKPEKPALPPALPTPQVVADAARIGHMCNIADVEQALASTKAPLMKCYEGLLKNSPTLHGTVMLEWFITQGGMVAAQKVKENDSGSNQLADCVTAAHSVVRYKPHPGKMCVIRWPVGFVAPLQK